MFRARSLKKPLRKNYEWALMQYDLIKRNSTELGTEERPPGDTGKSQG
jgi:hypothetical protein